MVTEKEAGEAYALFKCGATSTEIQDWLPIIKEMARVPSELELTLSAGVPNIADDLFVKAKNAGLNHTIKANLSGNTNYETASGVALILNGLSGTSLYAPGDKFRAVICYKENGKYELLDKEGYVI